MRVKYSLSHFVQFIFSGSWVGGGGEEMRKKLAEVMRVK
jgi:hypothetical protein